MVCYEGLTTVSSPKRTSVLLPLCRAGQGHPWEGGEAQTTEASSVWGNTPKREAYEF